MIGLDAERISKNRESLRRLLSEDLDASLSVEDRIREIEENLVIVSCGRGYNTGLKITKDGFVMTSVYGMEEVFMEWAFILNCFESGKISMDDDLFRYNRTPFESDFYIRRRLNFQTPIDITFLYARLSEEIVVLRGLLSEGYEPVRLGFSKKRLNIGDKVIFLVLTSGGGCTQNEGFVVREGEGTRSDDDDNVYRRSFFQTNISCCKGSGGGIFVDARDGKIVGMQPFYIEQNEIEQFEELIGDCDLSGDLAWGVRVSNITSVIGKCLNNVENPFARSGIRD
jgi:hypothetical protein